MSIMLGLSEIGLVSMIRQCTALTELDLPLSMDSVIIAIAESCPLLQDLHLSRSSTATESVSYN